MSAPEFVAYVGPPEIHDSTVASVAREGDVVRVDLRTLSGQSLALTFCGVISVHSHRPEGMFLYALVEMVSPTPPLRRFVFANSDEDASSALQLIAETFTIDGPQT